MSLLKITREDFMDRYTNHNTKMTIKNMFILWDRFCKEREVAESDIFMELRKPENEQRRYIMLDQIRVAWEKKVSVNSAKVFFNYLKGWWKYNEIKLDTDTIRQYVKWSKPIKERVRGIDRTMIKNLLDLCNPIYKLLYYMLPYSGQRIGSEAIQIEWSWIDFDQSPPMITIPGRCTKTKQERITFVGGEGERLLREERKRRKDEPENTKIFRVRQKDGAWRDILYPAAYQYFARRRARLGYTERGANKRYHFRPHKLRGYAENKMGRGSGGSEFAHSMLGHTEGLIEYNQSGTTDNDARLDYISAMQHLAITDEERLKDENSKLKDQITTIKEVKRQQDLLTSFLQAHPQFAESFARFARK